MVEFEPKEYREFLQELINMLGEPKLQDRIIQKLDSPTGFKQLMKAYFTLHSR